MVPPDPEKDRQEYEEEQAGPKKTLEQKVKEQVRNRQAETKKKLDAGEYQVEQIPDMADIGKAMIGEM